MAVQGTAWLLFPFIEVSKQVKTQSFFESIVVLGLSCGDHLSRAPVSAKESPLISWL